ncbi:alkaline phosphatase [Pseudoxanthomonas composti]|uniref:Alkaline phosphatase n=1 Tax=Pseudoxanthomonas composti TaxID=2137479 RepID=A0A4Q1JUH6_9GAMM|nr:alkaline phosphatase [Pseudoxanthomonas composti]RXR05360.1 alkaline phosphatase [Pseudoxanthomonas composti]
MLARSLPLATLSTLILAACATAPAPRAPAAASLSVEVPAVRHPQGETPQWWYRSGAATAAANGAMQGKARNVILFLGDGMSLTTVAAARVLEGQRKGAPGEENRLSWETFPATAFSKTYNTDSQVPDSAGTMTAITTGVKSHMGAIGVSSGTVEDCAGSLPKRLLTLLELADSADMATGIVSTARITHATPAATYAHVPDRDWESDADLPAAARSQGCVDIAQQLLGAARYGRGPQVVLGGGRYNFLPKDQADPQTPDQHGKRADGRDLVAEWKAAHPQGAFVLNTAQLRQAAQAPAVLGLFSRSHMDYDHDRDTGDAGQPSLAEMTRTAIDKLSGNANGYVLMVEGARIDMANHESNAYRALDDTIALSDAVKAAMDATSAEDTLIVVTADHSHVLNFVGYPVRGNPILDKVRGRNAFNGAPGDYAKDLRGLPYTTLSYANGPGNTGASDKQPAGSKHFSHEPKQITSEARRPDLTQVDTTVPDYLQESLVPLSSESHGGDDVGIWSRGPGSQAFRGSLEQNAIYHVLVQATPRLRQRLCQAGTCDAQGVPVELPRAGAFERGTSD